MTPRAAWDQRTDLAPIRNGRNVRPRRPGAAAAASASRCRRASSCIGRRAGAPATRAAAPDGGHRQQRHRPARDRVCGGQDRPRPSTCSVLGMDITMPVAVPMETIASSPPTPLASASAARSAAPVATGIPERSPRRGRPAGRVTPAIDPDGRMAGSAGSSTPTSLDHLRPPGPGPTVHEHRAGRARWVGHGTARQSQDEVVLRLEHPASPGDTPPVRGPGATRSWGP